jgi:hypothetical protein
MKSRIFRHILLAVILLSGFAYSQFYKKPIHLIHVEVIHDSASSDYPYYINRKEILLKGSQFEITDANLYGDNKLLNKVSDDGGGSIIIYKGKIEKDEKGTIILSGKPEPNDKTQPKLKPVRIELIEINEENGKTLVPIGFIDLLSHEFYSKRP